jgi:imidazolonepropionase-like amidohydrolase
LALLVEAGLSPYDAIRAATRTPSEIFPPFGDVGVVKAGHAANLVLTTENPLEDVSVLRRPDSVVIDGIYLDRATLDQHMAILAERWGVR